MKSIKSFKIITNSFFLNLCKFPLLFILILPTILADPHIRSAEAYCNSPWDCPDLDPTDNRSPANPGNLKNTIQNNLDRTFKISLKNNTSNTIWVAINRVLVPDSSEFYAMGYWEIAPGEKAYVADTPNRIVYFSAHDRNGKYWGDENTQFKVLRDGKIRPFFKTDMGDSYTSFTQEFN